ALGRVHPGGRTLERHSPRRPALLGDGELDLQVERPAVALDGHRDLLAVLGPANRVAQVLAVLHRLPVELQDDVAGLEPGLARGPVLVHGSHQHPSALPDLEIPGELALDLLVLDSQLAGARAQLEEELPGTVAIEAEGVRPLG